MYQIAVIVWSIFQSRQYLFVDYGLLEFTIDYLLNVGMILLVTTVYSEMPIYLGVLVLALGLFTYLIPACYPKRQNARPWATRHEKESEKKEAREALDELPMKPFLTTYRGCMMVVTCLAILAVDFRIFPRRFAKVENWGTSLMDLGVGSFVFSAGVVAARQALKERLAARKGKRSAGLGSKLFGSIRHSVPLIVLGFIRLYSVKGLDYAEHVTEYGVHWNFFFTLALLPPFVALFQSLFEIIPSYAALAILLGCVYQVVLEFTDLKAYILTAPRTDFLSQNREGLFSFTGYLSIFLAGQSTGIYVIPRWIRREAQHDGRTQRLALITTLIMWSVGWIILYFFATSYSYGLGLTVSRRIANLPYFLWVSAFNTAQITMFCGIETWWFPAFHQATDKSEESRIYKFATSKILAAYNRNGLAVFLVANLLTGLVNMTVQTLYMSNSQAMGILLAYLAVVTGFAVTLDLYDISIKM